VKIKRKMIKELEDVKDEINEKEYNFLRNKIIKNAF